MKEGWGGVVVRLILPRKKYPQKVQLIRVKYEVNQIWKIWLKKESSAIFQSLLIEQDKIQYKGKFKNLALQRLSSNMVYLELTSEKHLGLRKVETKNLTLLMHCDHQKKSYLFKYICSFQVQVCLSMYGLLVDNMRSKIQ